MGWLSKAWKGVKKAVKKVAKSVKKVGSKVWSGIKKGYGKIMGAFGKLGPLGTIALAFVMPGIGSMLSGMWTSMAGSLAGGQFGTVLQAVGKGMQTAAELAGKAKTFIGNAASPITSKIQSAMEYVGGKITDGANYLVQGAQKAMGSTNPASIGDMGKYVVDKAKSAYQAVTGTKPAEVGILNQKAVQAAVDANPELMKMANFSGTSSQQLAAQQGQFLGSQLTNTQVNAATLADNPELVKMSNFSGEATPDIMTTGMKEASATNAGLDMFAGQQPRSEVISPTETTGESLLKRIAKAASAGFGNSGAIPSAMPQYSAGDVPDLTASSRFGVGGQGAAGGQFLSDAQRQQQALMAQILGQVG